MCAIDRKPRGAEGPLTQPRFNVVFDGETVESKHPDAVKKGLAEVFKCDVDAIEPLFSGVPKTIAKSLDADRARAVVARLNEIGALVYLEDVLEDALDVDQVDGAPDEGAAATPPAPATRQSAPKAAPRPPESPARAAASHAPPRGRAEAGPPSSRAVLRYRFDSFMARGGSSIFKALVATFAAVFVAIGVARVLFRLLSPETELQYDELDALGNLYVTFLQLTDPGNMAQDILSSPSYKVFSILAGLSGVIMLSALIAFITNALDQKISELKRGHSKVIETGHTLILGWNEQRIVEIVRELILANESEPDGCAVILADRDKEEMDDALRLRLPDRKTTRIVTRSGQVTSEANLDMVSSESCKSILVLATCDDTDDASAKAASDATVIQTILAVSPAEPDDDEFCIVAEIYNPTHREIVESTFGEHVVTVDTSDILAKLLVQTSRSVGLSVVYNEILSFDGCEMYFYGADWGDIDFERLAYHFDDGVPVGLRSDGVVTINPPAGHRMRPGDEILIVADDDSTIEYLDAPVATPTVYPLADRRLEQTVERELIIGWNHKAPVILREFADYVEPGSHVCVMLKDPSQAERDEILALDAELEDVSVEIIEGDPVDRDQLLAVRPFTFDNIILLAGGGSEDVEVARIDSENIVALLLLRSIFDTHPEESGSTKLITEVLDSQNCALMTRAGVKDVIISNRLVSMIMAQISEGRDIKKVYDDIFQEDGSEIYLKPISLYFDRIPSSVTFADLMGIARQREEVCIGVKVAALESSTDDNHGVQLIPDKNARFSLAPADCLIVVSEDEL